MSGAAEGLRFEEASVLRDRIAAIEETLERQRIVSMTGRNRDVFGLCREDDMTQISLLFVRGGRMIGQKTFPLIRLRAETGEILSALLMRYYDNVADIPDEVVVPVELEDGGVLAEWLAEKKGRGVSLVSPKRGETLALVGIAGRNAENALKTARLAADRPEEALRMLCEKLKLRTLPRRIECFDISNIGGKHAVGSLVAFTDGVPAKEGYRRFRIRTVPDADDYAMMYEVLKRRFEKKENLPDLVIVDGGKGQLGVALAVLKDLGIEGMDVIGLAKERDNARSVVPNDALDFTLFTVGTMRVTEDEAEGVGSSGSEEGVKCDSASAAGSGGRRQMPEKEEDRVYLPGRKDSVYLTRWPAAIFLLQRIRDEAHRFAVVYHRKVKEKEDLQSFLDRIEGVGPARRKALLIFFGDVKRIRAASVADLQRVEGIGEETARRIHAFLDGDGAAPGSGATDGSAESNPA
jgi:excinuclease ABC subunit C